MTRLEGETRRADDSTHEASAKSESYPTTSWSVVHAAAGGDSEQARAALLTLAQRYREPVRRYLLRDGYTGGNRRARVALLPRAW
jgi:hypothetical protein